MRAVRKFILFCAFFFVFQGRSTLAACPDTVNNAGYVRAGAGGTASGADWTNAYTQLPASLARGCTYYVAAGTYHGHLFADADSGTSLITVQAATIAAHGTATGWSNAYQGQAVFNTADSSGVGDIFTFQTDYYTINGVYRSTATGLPETDWVLESGYGFKVDNSGKVAGVADIALGENSNTTPLPVHDITIEYVDVNGSHSGDAASGAGPRENGLEGIWGSHDYTLQYNYIHDTGLTTLFLGGAQSSCSAAGPPPTCSSTPNTGYGNGSNITIAYNYFARNYSDASQHAEGCSCHDGLKNLTFAYNYWQDINGTAIIAPATAADWNTGNGNTGPWYIYGNVIFMSACSAVDNGDKNPGIVAFVYLFDSAWTDNLYVFNNTIGSYGTGCGTGSGIALDDGTYKNPMNAVYVQNNLWWNTTQTQAVNSCPSSGGSATCTSITWGYNAYFASPDNSGSGDSSGTKQISASNPFNNSSTYDFRLASNTTAGTSTHSLVAANDTDLFGTTRAANGTWDRGAFQIAGASSSPSSISGACKGCTISKLETPKGKEVVDSAAAVY